MGRGAIPLHLGFARCEMPRCGVIGCYPPFPAAIPERGAGSPRVTQPFATRFPPERGAVRLACVRRAASVHPEPGSNSPSNLQARSRGPSRSQCPSGRRDADRIHLIRVRHSGVNGIAGPGAQARPHSSLHFWYTIAPRWVLVFPKFLAVSGSQGARRRGPGRAARRYIARRARRRGRESRAPTRRACRGLRQCVFVAVLRERHRNKIGLLCHQITLL